MQYPGEPCTLRDMEYWQDPANNQKTIDWLIWRFQGNGKGPHFDGQERTVVTRMLKHVVSSLPEHVMTEHSRASRDRCVCGAAIVPYEEGESEGCEVAGRPYIYARFIGGPGDIRPAGELYPEDAR